jgi:ABC-type multidrug transport system ATPase subunit
MLELTALDKSFGSRRLLSDASLVIRAGECVALIGANGSGKTTTLRCAVGLARPDRGNVRIDGIDMRTRPVDARARLSYLAQRTDFPSTLTVREILTVVADLRRADSRAVDREIAMCGLTRLATRTVGQLSGGERQRVAMAALFIPDAAVYLLDEPTMNLDPAGAGLLIDRLTEVRDKGRAILFTTHVAAGLEGLATRVAALRNGRIDDLRHECSLAAALERLHQEGARHETEAADSGAIGIPHRDVWQQLWRGAWWPGTDSAGSR